MNKKIVKILMATLLIASLAASLIGCGAKTSSVENSKSQLTKVEQIKKAGKIVLGTSADYPPYEFYKEINGKLEVVGFDIEIAKEIAKDLGVDLEIKDMKFEGLLAALEAGNIDFIVAGMVPTEERKKSVDFSKTYYQAEQHMIIRAADKDKLKTVEDLKGLKIGAQKSTVQETIATEQIPGATVRSLAKITDLVLELKNNKVDGVVLVAPVAASYAKQNSDIVVPSISFGKEDGVAIAVKKGTEDFLQSINSTLDRLIKDDIISKFIEEATILAEE